VNAESELKCERNLVEKVKAKKIDFTSISSIEFGELGSIIKCFRTYVPSLSGGSGNNLC